MANEIAAPGEGPVSATGGPDVASGSPTTSEEWGTIAFWDDYQVSDRGRVRSWKYGTPRLLSLSKNKGYVQAQLWRNNRQTTHPVHRLVLWAFVGPPPEGCPDADHLNGIRDDNRLENLEWVSTRENLLRSTVQRGVARTLECPWCESPIYYSVSSGIHKDTR